MIDLQSDTELNMKKLTFKFWNDILDEDNYVETVWAEIIDEEKGHFQIENVPFFVKSYSVGDIVFAELENDELIVKDLVKESGNSTVNIVFFKTEDKEKVLKELNDLGCDFEGLESVLPGYYSLNISRKINYEPIKSYLSNLRNEKVLDFREACLAHTI